MIFWSLTWSPESKYWSNQLSTHQRWKNWDKETVNYSRIQLNIFTYVFRSNDITLASHWATETASPALLHPKRGGHDQVSPQDQVQDRQQQRQVDCTCAQITGSLNISSGDTGRLLKKQESKRRSWPGRMKQDTHCSTEVTRDQLSSLRCYNYQTQVSLTVGIFFCTVQMLSAGSPPNKINNKQNF